MFGSKTPFGSGGFGSTTSAFGSQQSTPFGATSGGGKLNSLKTFCFFQLRLLGKIFVSYM